MSGATAAQAVAVGGVRQRGRRLVCRHVRLLERTLFRAGRRLCARPRHAAADPAGRHRAGAHRGDRRDRLRPRAAAACNAPPLVPAQEEAHTPKVSHPRSGLSRAAGDAEADARCRRAPRLSQFRMRGGHQQHARSGAVAADRGALPHARRTLQIRPGDNLPASRPARCALALVHTAADAEIIGVIDADYVVEPDWLKDLVPLFADATRRLRAGAAGSPRRRPPRHALRHERRICRLLRHRHGAAERGQRHHRARHHVPDPPRGAGSRRRLVERHHLRGHRSRPRLLEHGWQRALHQPALRPRPAARHFRRLQEAAPPLGLWRIPDPEQALAPLPAAGRAASRATRSANSRSAGSIGSAPKASASSVAMLNIIWVPVVAFLDIAVPDRILTLPIIATFTVSVLAFRHALSAARAHRPGQAGRRRVRRHVGAMDGGARGRLRRRSRISLPFVRTAKGGCARKGRFPRPSGRR